MSIQIQGYTAMLNGKDAVQGNITVSGTGITLNKFFPFTINVYGRISDVNPPAIKAIEVSLDGNTYEVSGDIMETTLDDPRYTLMFTYVGINRDIYVRPLDTDVMLGDQISETGSTVIDYPYTNIVGYTYSIHNGQFINNNVDLYFQIASF